MLSYLHAFHAGNHADILKHAALIQLLKKLNQKSAPYSFFDTHAGSGLYSTQGEKARKTGEAARGVLALAECAGKEAAQDLNGGSPNLGLATDTDSRPKSGADQEALQVQNGGGQQETDASLRSGGALPAAISDYLNFVRPYLARDLYPGSPLIERAFLRPGDAHTICELHPTEFEALKENCARDFGLRSAFDPDQEAAAPNFGLPTDTASRQKSAAASSGPSAVPHTQILKADGFKTLLAQTPPKIKRGAALIDPSYEEAADYDAVAKTVIAVHKKWSAGIIMVWYPLLAHRAAEIEKMIESICAAAKIQNANTNILRADFCVDTAQSHTEMPLKENAAAKAAAALSSKTGLSSAAPRLYGSGILVLNAPWKLDQELDEALKYLSRVPGLATEPSYTVELL
ncbi:MAG: 23S rRNA (adenine(2030)-N(6))-methyltransferase RlmJ [Treponema sp.]|nr:23S rRNA (adenine(2030)-N(6))-methyltransferase RlmJ [Treponema sp.]